jgi:pimeloyl-ACP methyl ester carboxylesterase
VCNGVDRAGRRGLAARSGAPSGRTWQLAANVTGGVIANSGHWVMEEQPKQSTAAIVDFIEKDPELRKPTAGGTI